MATRRQSYVDRFRSFPCLVEGRLHLAPGGTVQSMADVTGIDHNTLLKWMRGRTKVPPEAMVRQWAEAMGVPVEDALALRLEDQMRRLRGEPVPLPDLSYLRPGPPPRSDSVRSLRLLRKVRRIAGGSSDDGTLPVATRPRVMPLIRHWLHNLWEQTFAPGRLALSPA